MNRTEAISKMLSRNDTSETGGHQGGILIPKQEELLSFFPPLTNDDLNPRRSLTFYDSTGNKWVFSIIHYNNRLFGGTRNEYRLTGMTKFMRSVNAKAGDVLMLTRNTEGQYFITHNSGKLHNDSTTNHLVLGNSWRVIKIKTNYNRSTL